MSTKFLTSCFVVLSLWGRNTDVIVHCMLRFVSLSRSLFLSVSKRGQAKITWFTVRSRLHIVHLLCRSVILKIGLFSRSLLVLLSEFSWGIRVFILGAIFRNSVTVCVLSFSHRLCQIVTVLFYKGL